MRKRVVIIGSGLGGLSCGFILQRNGYDVTILEQNAQIGGCLQCFRRGGVKFETGMHFIGSADQDEPIYRIMNYLRLFPDVKLQKLDENGYDTISLNGARYKFANGKEPFISQMSEYFPKEKNSIRKYFDLIESISNSSPIKLLSPVENHTAEAAIYQTLSINEVIDSIIRDEQLRNVLVGNLPLYAAEKDRTPFSTHAFITDFYNRSAFRVAGGSDSIASSLCSSVTEMGGEVLTSKKVNRILCDGVNVKAVETLDGDHFETDCLISTIHPARLFEILDDNNLIRPVFRHRISSIPNTVGGFAVYLKFRKNTVPYMNTNFYGYTVDSPWGCETYNSDNWPKGYLYMHMCPGTVSQWAESGVILSYMQMDDVRQWMNTSVGRRGQDYETFKREHAEKLIDAVCKEIPSLRDSIDSYYTSTPLTYLNYTGTEDGSMYGVVKDITLGASGRVPYRTKIPNLLLAGQNVNSHGMMGVLVGTLVTCSELVPSAEIFKQIKNANGL